MDMYFVSVTTMTGTVKYHTVQENIGAAIRVALAHFEAQVLPHHRRQSAGDRILMIIAEVSDTKRQDIHYTL